MKRGPKIWGGDTKTLRQLKLCSILLILYFAAIIIYILATKDIKQQNVKRFSNREAHKVFLLVPFSINKTIYIKQLNK